MQTSRSWVALSHAAAALMAVASALGAVTAFPYARETASWAAQGAGQDLVNLFVVVPILILSAERTRHGSQRAHAVWVGALVYAVYSYVLYAFFVHFGPLFPLYVAILGLSGFALAGAASRMLRTAPSQWSSPRFGPWVGAWLIFTGGAFALLWLADIVPALVAGTDPSSVADSGFWVNPIHVLDLAFVLPAMVVVGVLVLRRHPLGVRCAVAMSTFSALMGLAIVAMMAVMARRGLSADPLVAGGMLVVTVMSAVVAAALQGELPDRRLNMVT